MQGQEKQAVQQAGSAASRAQSWSHLQQGVGRFAIGNDSGDAMLGSHPGSLHLGSHAHSPTLAVRPNLHQLIVHGGAIGLDHAAQSEANQDGVRMT